MFISFLSTTTSRAATNNNDCSHDNNAVDVVEKLFHFILVSFQNAFFYTMIFSTVKEENKKYEKIFQPLELPERVCYFSFLCAQRK